MATASQDEGTVLQFFMYASIAPDIMCLSLHINKIEKMLHVVSKAASEVLAELLNKYIRNFLTLNEFM